MADAYRGLTIEFNGDTTRLSKALSQINKDTRSTGNALAQVEKGLKFNPGNMTLVTQQQKYLRDSIGLTAQKLEQLKKTNESYANAVGPLSKDEIAGWEKVQREIVTTESTLKHYKQTLAESIVQQGVAESSLGKFGGALESFGGRVKPVGDKLDSLGRVLSMTLTPAVAAAGVAAFTVASNFESSMSRVAGALNDPNANMEELSALALQMGQDTIFSASEAGAAMEELAKGGLTSADIQGGALATTMGLAAAGGLDLATAASTVVQSMGAFGLSADQTGEAANALAGAAAASSADVSDLSQGLSQVSAQANSAGWSIQDTTAVLGGFADAGIKGSDAGTSLKTMLQRLAAPTEKAADMVAALGINVRDSDGIMLDAAGVAQELQDKLGGLSSAEKDMAMQTIFGSDASRAALVVTNLGREGIEKYTAATNDQNAAQRLADSQMGDSQRAIEEMKGAIETAAIKLGTSLSPSIVGVAEAVGKAAEKFSSMDEETQQAIVQAVALSAVLGPVLMLFGKGVKTIEGFGRGLQTMAKFFANVDIKTSSASRSLDGYSAATKTSSAATTGLAGSTRAASVAMGGLKTAIIGTGIGALVVTLCMAIGLVMEFVDANNKAADRTRRAGEANNALRRSLDGLDSGFETAKSAASDYSVTADEVRTKTEDMTQAHKDLADSLTDSMSEAGSNAGMLESYMGIIESLGTKSNLTGEEQAKLKEAVAKVNDACGTSFQITNDQNGALYGQVDAIRAVISAQQDRIRYEAASEGWKDVLKQQEADLIEIQRLEQQKSDLLEKTKGETAGSPWDKNKDIEALNETVTALGTARESYRSTSETAKQYEERVGSLGAALGSSVAEITEFANSNEAITNAFSESSQSLDAFSSELSKCGVSTTELSSLSNEQLASLVQSYDGSTQSIVSKLQEFGLAAKVEGKSASSNLATGISEGTQQVLQAASGVTGKTIEQIGAECASFGIEGDAAIAAYATALANGSTQAAAAAAATGAASGDATGQNYADALAAKRELAVVSALQVTGMTLEQFNASAAQAGVEGDEATAAYAASLSARAWDAQAGGTVVAGSATAGMGTGDPSAGGQLGSLFSSGVADNAWNSKIAGESLAGSASDGAQSQNWNASSWGAHLGDNFASGISGAIEWVSNAATSLADAVWSVLGHTVPKEGPLRNGGKGETEWGAHTVQNYVSGIRSQIPELKKAMNEVSAATASPLSLTEKIRLGTQASAARAKLAAAQSVNTSSVSNDNRQSAVTINVSVQGGNEQSARAIAQEIYTLEQRAARGMRR